MFLGRFGGCGVVRGFFGSLSGLVLTKEFGMIGFGYKEYARYSQDSVKDRL